MWNGFYNLNHLDTRKLKQFFKESIQLSYNFYIHKLDSKVSREMAPELSLLEYLNKYLSLKTHNVAIDRFEYNAGSSIAHCTDYVEVGNRYSGGRGEPDYFIFIYINREKFKKLIIKYELTKREL